VKEITIQSDSFYDTTQKLIVVDNVQKMECEEISMKKCSSGGHR
jgi:hypothetical protein